MLAKDQFSFGFCPRGSKYIGKLGCSSTKDEKRVYHSSGTGRDSFIDEAIRPRSARMAVSGLTDGHAMPVAVGDRHFQLRGYRAEVGTSSDEALT